jgi:predicted DsbA family dithiol-disulfide isomerase
MRTACIRGDAVARSDLDSAGLEVGLVGDGAASGEVIEVYADIWCPFTHVGLRRLVAARDARGSDARIRVRAWPLEWVNGRPLASDLVAQEIGALGAEVAAGLFAGFDPARWPRSTIPALGLAAAAYRVGNDAGEGVSLRLRDALFEEGRDVSDEAELRALGLEFGVEPLTGPSAEAAVRVDWERGQARNVRGSPHFFVGTRGWFCPSLRIRHEGTKFDISIDREALDAFYATALG